MGFYQIYEDIINTAFTLNGDKAYKSTGYACLDYFGIIGGKRNNIKDALMLFVKAYQENPKLALKILFYIRDIRGGLGERDIFRATFCALANKYPEVAIQLIEYIPQYGRYDDLLVCLDTPLKNRVIAYINKQLKEDVLNKESHKSISLLAKWLPSINTSSADTRRYALRIVEGLKMSKAEYRKILSFLRDGIIIENNLSEVDYSFDYSKVPSYAMYKYRRAFVRHDRARYVQYLTDVKAGKSKMNASTLYPYEITRTIRKARRKGKKFSQFELDSLDAMWQSIPRSEITSKTIVVRDGSGSMLGDYGDLVPDDIATSLAILFAEQLTGEFKDTFITFSKNPKIVKIAGETIKDKCDNLFKYADPTNTDIKKVYQLILDVYKNPNFRKEDALDSIVIISDMEFDALTSGEKSTFEFFKEEFAKLGYPMPKMIFWNVYARDVRFPVKNEAGVELISGASNKLIDIVTKYAGVDAYEFMLNCLEKYDFVDKINLFDQKFA